MNKGTGGLIILAIIVTVIVYAAMAVAAVCAICALCYGIFILIRYFHVGKITNPKADPLCSKIAKHIVSKQNVSVEEICSLFSIDVARCNFIIKQLEQIGIVDNKKATIKDIWDLGAYFKKVNANDNYFLEIIENQLNDELAKTEKRINAEIEKIEDQINKESDLLIKQFLKNIERTKENKYWIKFLEKKKIALSAYSSNEDINTIDDEINKRKTGITINPVNINVESHVLTVFDDFKQTLLSLKNNKQWTGDKKSLSVNLESFFGTTINDNEFLVPCMNFNGYQLYFYPECIIKYVADSLKIITKISYNDLNLYLNYEVICKSSWFGENDAEYMYSRYRHQCLDGTPDLRYNHNPATRYFKFYCLGLSPLSIQIFFGNEDKPKELIHSFDKFRSLLYSSQSNKLAVKQSNNSSSAESGITDLRTRIIETIKKYDIQPGTIKAKTFVSILKDYHVFQNREDKAYANILKSALDNGTLQTILNYGFGHVYSAEAIEAFIVTSGYDQNKTKNILSYVADAYYK